ncbi:hypothetical protein [Variovorax sp. HJSM1_2]|uniref:hypothetical protein n=1 Tax=Variovorax sp. HJSM1_2 TaxID=3366263 RepID=UPI003BE97ADB
MSNSIPSMEPRGPASANHLPFSDAAEQQREALHHGDRLARRRGLRDWLRQLWPGAGRSPSTQMARIRNAMLQELAQLPVAETASEADAIKAAQTAKWRFLVARQIAEANDAEILWRLRGNLTQAMGACYSPVVVHQRMAEISFMFAGLLHRRAPCAGDNVVQLPTRPSTYHLPPDRPTSPSTRHQI